MIICPKWTGMDGGRRQTVHLMDGFRRRTIKNIKMWRWTGRQMDESASVEACGQFRFFSHWQRKNVQSESVCEFYILHSISRDSDCI